MFPPATDTESGRMACKLVLRAAIMTSRLGSTQSAEFTLAARSSEVEWARHLCQPL